MPSWEPLPAYSTLCRSYREANNSKDCTWNIITTVWDARGIKSQGGKGANDMVIRVEHLGIADDSKTFEKSVNEIPNRVFKRQFWCVQRAGRAVAALAELPTCERAPG
jgi:hypothetical protein